MDALKVLKEHENEIKRRFGVKRIGIFGSHARGEEKETSDVDVLVEFVEPSHRPLCGGGGGLGWIKVMAPIAPGGAGMRGGRCRGAWDPPGRVAGRREPTVAERAAASCGDGVEELDCTG